VPGCLGRELFGKEFGRAPADARELSEFLAGASRQRTTAVAGYVDVQSGQERLGAVAAALPLVLLLSVAVCTAVATGLYLAAGVLQGVRAVRVSAAARAAASKHHTAAGRQSAHVVLDLLGCVAERVSWWIRHHDEGHRRSRRCPSRRQD